MPPETQPALLNVLTVDVEEYRQPDVVTDSMREAHVSRPRLIEIDRHGCTYSSARPPSSPRSLTEFAFMSISIAFPQVWPARFPYAPAAVS